MYSGTTYHASWHNHYHGYDSSRNIESSHAKATQELDDEQDRIHYRIDMHGNTMSPEPVMHSIKEVDEDASDEEMS